MSVLDTRREGLELHHSDALALLGTLASASVDLILTDPPYFRVKDEPWDRQWDTPQGFLAWIGALCDEFRRVLRPNGSLYLFASPEMAGRVECVVRERFNVLNHIVWVKHDGTGYGTGGHSKVSEEVLRSYFSQTERVIFAEQWGADGNALSDSSEFLLEPLRVYLDSERIRAGVRKDDCNEACGFARSGGMASRKYFSQSEWCLPTREHYETLQRLLNSQNGGGYLTRPYEDLRQEYEALRRPFQATPDAPYTDVWDFPTVAPYPGKHPCEKPQALLRHIVEVSSRPGTVVLDCCCGSGATGEAALSLGRSFIGGDASAHWSQYALARLERRFGALPVGDGRHVKRRPVEGGLFSMEAGR